jgi:protein SCO1/2
VDSEPKLDADINQHTGMVRIGTDIYDKWGGCPSMASARSLASAILSLDPYERDRPHV